MLRCVNPLHGGASREVRVRCHIFHAQGMTSYYADCGGASNERPRREHENHVHPVNSTLALFLC